MNPNLSIFARLAAPAPPMRPPAGMPRHGGGMAMPQPGPAMAAPGMPGAAMPGPSGPPPAMTPGVAKAAALGRGGDKLMAHMTPGEIVVPREIQNPEVLTALNKAFASAGANPTSFQAGSPDQKVNPATGLAEFGFFDSLLPTILGIAGSAFLGPEVLAPAFEGLGAGASTAGILGGAAGGFLGNTAGNLLTGVPLGKSLALGAGGAIGSGLGSALAGGASTVGGLLGLGPTEAADIGPNALAGAGMTFDKLPLAAQTVAPTSAQMAGSGLASDAIRNAGGMAGLPGGGLSPTGLPLSGVAGAADTAGPDFWTRLQSGASGLGDINLKQLAGSTLGGALGSQIAGSFFPPPQVKPDLGPPLPPLSQLPPLSNYIGGGNGSINAGPIQAGPAQFPTNDYLKNYGRAPQFNFFPTS